MIFSHIIEEKNNIKIEILEEAKFMIEHDFQMMNPGRHVISCFWWLVQALGENIQIPLKVNAGEAMMVQH